MLDSAPAVFVALEGSGLGQTIRQSSWIYMTANVGHIVALVVFAGAVAVLDLRMIGAFAATAPGRVLTGARRAVIGAFLALLLTGAVLFTAEASHVIMNRVFQVKLALIALGLVNVALFESLHRSESPRPAAARARCRRRRSVPASRRLRSGLRSRSAGAASRISERAQNPVKSTSSAAMIRSRSPASEPRGAPSADFRTVTSSCAISTNGPLVDVDSAD